MWGVCSPGARLPGITPTDNDRTQASDMAPAVVASLARQIRQLATAPPDGVRFYPNEKGLSEIDASIDGPGTSEVSPQNQFRPPAPLPALPPRAVDTPYYGGVFRLKLTLGHDYPAAPPKGPLRRERTG